MNDLISRKAAIKAMECINDSICAQQAVDALCDLPTAEKVGKWIKVPGYCTPGGDPVWACSECGKGIHVYGIEHNTYGSDISDGQWVACPNCGARMGKGERMKWIVEAETLEDLTDGLWTGGERLVRCNQCKFYEGVHDAPGCAPCTFWGIGAVMWDDFCKRGERWDE